MKKTMLALLFLGCSTVFAETHFSIGIGIGGYGPVYGRVPPPPPEYYEQTPCPGDGYSWVDGYWSPSGERFFWRQGYWRAPAYFGYRGERGYDRGYVRAYGWRDGGYDPHERGREWRRDEHHGRERNEYRHEERRDRHEARRDHEEGNGWRR